MKRPFFFVGPGSGEGILAGASMRHLRSGHSHEDIDQTFGSLSLFIVKRGRCVETPSQFCEIIQAFCATCDRPFEAERSVCLLDQHRPWKLDVCFVLSFVLERS